MAETDRLRYYSHRLFTYRLPYHRPVVWRDSREDGAEFLGLELTTDCGATGWAEITLKPTWNGASVRSAVAALEDLLIPRLNGVDLSKPDDVTIALAAIPDNQAAKTLLDNALWDARSQHQGRALWEMWNGNPAVDLSWAVTRQAPRAMCDEAIQYVETYGFKVLKVKGGQGFDTDLQAIAQIQEALPDVHLYVDTNSAYTLEQAHEYVRHLSQLGVIVIEDPCTLSPDSSFSALQASSTVPVLVDFDCASARDAELFLGAGAQALSLKPGRLGLSATRKMGSRLAQDGKMGVVGLFGESTLGSLCALQLAASLPCRTLPAEVTWYLSMTRQFFTAMPPIQDGSITLPHGPLPRDQLQESMREFVPL